MKINYLLRNAITLNATGEKYDLEASPILLAEIGKHKKHFTFHFGKLAKEYTIYKLTLPCEPNILQGSVAFRQTPGALHCANMETNMHNKGKGAIYSGIGIAMIALCCKYSFDYGMEGYIFFDAKTNLIPYNERYGAKRIGDCEWR